MKMHGWLNVQNRGQHSPIVYLDVLPLARKQVLEVLILLLGKLHVQNLSRLN